MATAITQLPAGYRWPSGLPCYVGEIGGVRLEVLAARAGLAVEHHDEAGLGPGASAGAVLPSGVVVWLTELEHLIEHYGMTGPSVEADTAEVAARGAAAIFAEVLAAFGLDRSHVAHEPPPGNVAV